jgi:uncharacterized membrane protein YqhA
MDAFLIALVLMIFSVGVLDMFVESVGNLALRIPQGLRISSIGQLEKSLAEVIVIILLVRFLELVLLRPTHLPWEALTLPLAAGLRLLELGGRKRAEPDDS